MFIDKNALKRIVCNCTATRFEDDLTHCVLVMSYGDTYLGHHWLVSLLVAWRYQGINYQHQCWLIITFSLSITHVRRLHFYNYYHISQGQWVCSWNTHYLRYRTSIMHYFVLHRPCIWYNVTSWRIAIITTVASRCARLPNTRYINTN